MNNMNQLQLDYPVWRLPFLEYGEMKRYDLSQTEATTQWFDENGVNDHLFDPEQNGEESYR